MNIDPNNVETRPNMVLTRFLYPKDEVKISLLLALIQKKSVNECLFWASELIYSGFIDDITQLLWSIYYDFYAQHNPNLMKKVSISLKKLSENNIEPLFNLLKTMRTRPLQIMYLVCVLVKHLQNIIFIKVEFQNGYQNIQ